MSDNKLKWSLEKLFNTVGRNLAMNYYGFDSEYEVVSIIDEKTGEEVTDSDLGNTENYTATVKSKEPLPEIFDVKIEPLFRYGKYAQPMDLQFNLENLTKYISPNQIAVQLVGPEWSPGENTYRTLLQSFEDKWGRSLDRDANDFQASPNSWIELSNGSVVDKITGDSFPLMSNGLIDKTEVWNIARVDDDEWWDSLSDEDKRNLTNNFS
tara:strand:- start:1785 stop:2414 length:630 start_codon:yes stop_codon:yes gene_type:complete